MRDSRRQAPTVNAGSMADIAFLLLIFFLVTTTISADKGILRKLPAECLTPDCNIEVNDRNVLEIFINRNNELMVEGELIEVSDLKTLAIDFIDNDGANQCDYCNGKQLETSSDKPQDAIISLKHDSETSYGTFIDVQDEISKAYLKLRTAYAKSKFNKLPEGLTKDELIEVKKAYPFILSEVQLDRNQ
ncbi:ExbD/TolR family protein [Winogradskyella litorisediminis]|uniref:ExbD/TolR family protein n=1 Tax=Winogradskyella litorisediminis TaxID=1156618 RepID=A0ABW3N2T6_9FLAO